MIWHAGLRHEWLTIGHTDNLAQASEELGGVDEILEYDRHGNLFVTWSKNRPEFQEGVVKYLGQPSIREGNLAVKLEALHDTQRYVSADMGSQRHQSAG